MLILHGYQVVLHCVELVTLMEFCIFFKIFYHREFND